MKIKDSSIFKSIITMGAGTVLAQLINVLVQPILTRIVPTEVLGIYTFIISLATMIIPIASLKMDMLIVSEADDNVAQYITDVCILICASVSFVYLIVICIAFIIPVSSIFKKYGAVVFLVPFIVFTNGLRFLFISYNNRYKQYKLIAGIGLLREGSRAVIQVASGIFQFGVVGQILGYALAPVFGFRRQTRDYIVKAKTRPKITFPVLKQILLNGKKQILYLVPAQFINSFSGSLVTICITSLYSAKALGYYSAGNRILDVPIIFIAANVSKVCYKEISEKVAKKEIVTPTLLKIIASISLVSLTGFGILYFIAPQLAEIVFGEGYYTAGVYIKCLCLMYAVRLVSSSFAGLFTVFGKQGFEFLLNSMLVVVAAVIFFIANSIGLQMEDYLWMMSIGYSLVYLVVLIGYIILCRKHDNTIACTNA